MSKEQKRKDNLHIRMFRWLFLFFGLLSITSVIAVDLDLETVARECQEELLCDGMSLVVVSVTPESLADRVGMHAGDIVVEKDGRKIKLDGLGGDADPADKLMKLKVLRKNRLIDFDVTVRNIGINYAPIELHIFRDVSRSFATSDYSKALEELKIIEDYCQSGCQATTRNGVLLFKGLSMYEERRYSGAIESLETLYENSEKGHAIGIEASTILVYLWKSYYGASQYRSAIKYLNLLKVAYQENGDSNDLASVLNDLGTVYNALGEHRKALSYLEKSLDVLVVLGDTSKAAGTRSNIGTAYAESGNYAFAIKYFNEALLGFRELGDQSGEIAALGNLAKAYGSLGNIAKQDSHNTEALTLQMISPDFDVSPEFLIEIGDRSYLSNEYGFARKAYDKAYELYDEQGSSNGQAIVFERIGRLLVDTGEYSEANKYFAASYKAYKYSNDKDGQAGAALNVLRLQVGLIGVQEGLFDDEGETIALSLAPGAILYSKVLETPEKYWKSLHLTALLYYQQGDIDSSIALLKYSVNNLQEFRYINRELSKENKENLDIIGRDVFVQLIELLLEEERLEEALEILHLRKEFDYSQFIRANSYNSFGEGKAPYTPAERGWVDGLEYILNQYIKAITNHDELVSKNLDVSAELIKELDLLDVEFSSYIREVRVPNASTAINKLRSTVTSENILKTVEDQNAGTVVVTVFQLITELHFIVSEPAGHFLYTKKIQKPLNALVSQFRHELDDVSQDHKRTSEQLHEIIFSPIEEKIKSVSPKSILWVLDGALSYVPLAALYDGERYLVEDYAQSLYNFPSKEKRVARRKRTKIAGLGVTEAKLVKGINPTTGTASVTNFSPLVHVENELHDIIKTKSNLDGVYNGTVHLNESFTKQELKQILNNESYSNIHIASHFKLEPGNDQSSFLLVGDDIDNKLTLKEFNNGNYQMDIDLLTLSACSTAFSGDGVEVDSFSTMAQKNGASSVLATLWAVNDKSTSLFMRSFYQLASSKSVEKIEALRKAQIEMLKNNSSYSHPYYWAPFVLSGNWK